MGQTKQPEQPIKEAGEIEQKQKKLDEQAAKQRKREHLRQEGPPAHKNDATMDPFKSEGIPPGDNPCACGSGKRQKECCGKL